MTSHNKPLKESHYDIRSFSYDHPERVVLPGEDIVVFEEEQPFDHVLIWTLMGIETLVILIPLILTGQSWWVFLLVSIIMVMTMSFLASLKLYSRMDDEGVHFRMKLLQRKERTVKWEEMDMIHVRKYDPIMEYGGWGMRGMGKNKAYNAGGNMGIQIKTKDGRRILVGTRKAEEAKDFLERRELLV